MYTQIPVLSLRGGKPKPKGGRRLYTLIPVLSLRGVSLSLSWEEVVYPDSGVKPKRGKPKPKGGGGCIPRFWC